MYNESCNTLATMGLNDVLLDKKKILLVGNATSMFTQAKPHGKSIDEDYDFVIRFGKGFPHPEFKQELGSRTDLWFFGQVRAGMYKHFTNVKWKIYTLACQGAYDKNVHNISVPRFMMDGRFQPYRDFALTGDLKYIKKVADEIHGVGAATRPSQGIQALHWLINVMNVDPKNITLVGFDFFGSEVRYTNADGQTHQVSSWHMPLLASPNDADKQNPHKGTGDSESFAEERYVSELRANRGLNFIAMSNNASDKQDRLEAVLAKMRGLDAKLLPQQ